MIDKKAVFFSHWPFIISILFLSETTKNQNLVLAPGLL